jgi:hypothetical protein
MKKAVSSSDVKISPSPVVGCQMNWEVGWIKNGGVNLSGVGGGVNSPETFYDYLRPQTIARTL